VLSATLCLSSLTAKAECEEVISRCDEVIQKQSDLIEKLGLAYGELRDEHAQTLEYLATANAEVDNTRNTKLYYGLAGFAAGVALGVLAASGR
jgi:hypothetical protein